MNWDRYDWPMVGRKIKAWREARYLSQQQLADMVGVAAQNTVSRWETGTSPPVRGIDERLAKLMGVSLASFLFDPVPVYRVVAAPRLFIAQC